MPLDTFLALLLFAFTTSITPGPNNMMLFASGVNFGFRRTIPHMFGIGAGFLSLLLGVGLGLGALLHMVPAVYTALKFAGGAYLVWIAWKIGTSRSLGEGTSGVKPMSFLGAAAFQWVNPKAWVMAVTAMRAVFNTADTHNLVVCTLCSCYPWSVLGLPPVWYKAPAYRSRAVIDPRGVLAEFGLMLPENQKIRVWDSTAELRYLVIPERPEGTEGMDERTLASLVSRDAMIGTAVARKPESAT